MILLMGIAGSGKGTQGKLLGATRGYHVLSTGEMLRNYGSAEQHDRMHKGEILGDDEVTVLLDKALQNLDDQNRTILDGYPRTLPQAEWLLSDENSSRFKIDYVLHLQASREAVKQRLHDRGRTDDHDAAIEARFTEYEQATLPILEYLRKNGIKIVDVNGEQPIENVHQEVLKVDASNVHQGQN